ncbi:MAG: argininosuccinate lyase [Deltaproteobacteria bacterium]|nr:argininosuccinate lyase [Deltaproteobacteria bacterium]
MSTKPWGGRFRDEADSGAEQYTASIGFDRRLYRDDIRGSVAHCRMLVRQGIITAHEGDLIEQGLTDVLREIEGGEFSFSPALEDIHMAIEHRLIEKIGPVGGKVHTGRSRNDQVALDVRMFLRREIFDVLNGTAALQRALLEQARRNLHVVMPSYTHLQHAQPILFSHYLMAYFEMLRRDAERLMECRRRVNVMPLGAGAGAGSGFPVDREGVARELGFPRITRNSLDAVSDRDFVCEFCFASAMVMMHLSRLAHDFILWSTEEFGFIELPDPFCTGSSMMPQKKNADVLELVRGRTGRVYGHLVGQLTVLKGLPMTYNRDLQEDKEALFDTVDVVKATVWIMAALVPKIVILEERARRAAGGFSTATDLADYLVERGIPFREAHEIVGRIVRSCLDEGITLMDMPTQRLAQFSEQLGMDAKRALEVDNSLKRRDIPGGTAPSRVQEAITEAERYLEEHLQALRDAGASDECSQRI